jgi:hypothetical protein
MNKKIKNYKEKEESYKIKILNWNVKIKHLNNNKEIHKLIEIFIKLNVKDLLQLDKIKE